jgi:uncharacterized protein YkwD
VIFCLAVSVAQVAAMETGRLSHPVEMPLTRDGQILEKINLPPETSVIVLQSSGNEMTILTRLGTTSVEASTVRKTGEDFSISEPALVRAAKESLRRGAGGGCPRVKKTNPSCGKSQGRRSEQPRPTGLPNGSENVASSNEAFEREVLELVNGERAKRRAAPLEWNENLARAARYHAADMAANGYFDHDSMVRRPGSSGGPLRRAGTWNQRVEAFDSAASGENIAHGQPTPAAVMKSWMNSSGHRANILRPTNRTIGIGFVDGYWVQNFGR